MNKYKLETVGTSDDELLKITDWGVAQILEHEHKQASSTIRANFWKKYHEKLEAWKDKKVTEALENKK